MIELVEIDESHTDFVVNLNNDEEFSKSFPRQSKITREGHLKFLKLIKERGDLYYIIKYKGKEVGTVSIYDIDKVNNKAEWGRFIVLPEYGSIAFPVSKMIIRKAFEEMKLHKLYAHILSSNSRVVTFNKILGFKEEGILKDHYCVNGEYKDVHYLSLINKKA